MACPGTHVSSPGAVSTIMGAIPDIEFPSNPYAEIITGHTVAVMSAVQGYAAAALSAATSAIGALGNIQMPDVTITIPDMDVGGIPSYDIDIGDFTITDPTPIPDPYFPFEYDEDYYQSPLRDAVQAKLLYDVIYGGTGLNADIEAEIMARETERDNLLLQEAIDKVSNDWSKRRFALPNGVLAANIRRIYTDWEYARLDKSRKIAEDSERIAIDNTRWANDTGVKLEQVKLDYHGNYWRRKLDGAIAVVNAGVQVFDSFVKKFVSHYEGMKAKAQAYAARAQALTAVAGVGAEIFRAQVALAEARGNVAAKVMDVQARIAEAIARIAVEVAAAAAQAASHIAAGALSALHASSSISENSSHSESSNWGISNSYHLGNSYSLAGNASVSMEARNSAANDTNCVDYHYYEED